MRLIDKDKIYQKAMDIIQDKAGWKAFAIANAIGMAETIEAEPVKHGKWINALEHCGAFVCSDCEYQSTVLYKYCPNCGAKMDGDNHE